MTRNQKIALGCGCAGCLGLIVVAVAGVLIYYSYRSAATRIAEYNRNFNRNANLNSNRNANDNADDSTNSSSSTSSASSATNLSEDEKHRLFQASAMTRDPELQRRVWSKLGLLEDDFSQGNKFAEFGAAHVGWLIRNYQWVGTVDTPEKARAYIDEHLPQ
jgi:hypothetical protein